MKPIHIKLANPRGFCAGVDRAIDIVECALAQFGAPIYVRHEVVHNRFVVDSLKAKGAVFVDELHQVPDQATVIFSAHGVSKAVRAKAAQRKLTVFDATCPLVTKVHIEVVRNCKRGYDTVLIGHKGHPEVEGTMGQWSGRQGGSIFLVESPRDVDRLIINNPDKISYVTQTTLSVDDTRAIIEKLQHRFPNIQAPRRDDICYATQNRQDAVKRLVADCDLLLVIGSVSSSNSNRLREIAEKKGIESYLIDNAEQIADGWLAGKNNIGVTAGASAPEILVKQVVKKLTGMTEARVSEIDGVKENITFAVPRVLRQSRLK